METVAIVVGALIVGLILYFVLDMRASKGPSSVVDLIPGSQPGDRELTNSTELPLSYNQSEGITYSYTGWILVKDFTNGYGIERRVMSRGDAPGLYLNSTSNAFVVKINTFGALETVLIPGISAMKWVHFAIVVDQRAVDIYINGILRQHHTLAQLPKQTTDPVVFGPGWKGVIGKVTYYAMSLAPEKIKRLSKEEPPSDLEVKPSSGSYFDITWYTGRLNSV